MAVPAASYNFSLSHRPLQLPVVFQLLLLGVLSTTSACQLFETSGLEESGAEPSSSREESLGTQFSQKGSQAKSVVGVKPAAYRSFAAPPPPPPAAEGLEKKVTVASQNVARQNLPSRATQKKLDKNCGGECVGNSGVTPELQRNLQAKARQARSCYNRALSNNDTELSGRLTVNVRVGRDGAACRASIGADTLRNESVSHCVKKRFLDGSFPKPKGGCVDVAIPINFVSQ